MFNLPNKALQNKIPFHEVKISRQEKRYLREVFKSGWLTTGKLNQLFERKFQEFLENYPKRHSQKSLESPKPVVKTASSCTACLHLSLEIIGVKNKEVIVPDITFVSTALSVLHAGGIPVLADVDERNAMLTPEAVEKKLTPKTKAVIVVHYAGMPADIDSIKEVVRDYSKKYHGDEFYIEIIEDAAHALPTLYKGRMVGTLSPTTCFSFYATKPLSSGEGGAVTLVATDGVDEKERDRRVELFSKLRLHGLSQDAWKRYIENREPGYDVEFAGYKYNFPDVLAALALGQLEKQYAYLKRRRDIAKIYMEAFGEYVKKGIMSLLEEPSWGESSWHLFPILFESELKKKIMKRLLCENIGFSIHFIPLHRFTIFKKLYPEISPRDYPNAEKFFSREISLPIFPELKKAQLHKIIEVIKDELKHM